MMSIAMIFPGQGSQKIGKLLNLAQQDNIIQQTFEEASEYLNYNLWNLINNESILKNNHSEYVQSAIFVTSVAIYKLWKKLGGPNPSISSGHSLGEYSALTCSNSINFQNSVKFIQQRAHIMKECVKNKKVSMKAIIGLDKSIIFDLCKKNSNHHIVNLASINSDDQIVISGYDDAVQKTITECKKKGAKAILNIPINIAAHSLIMKNITKKIFKKLYKIPFYSPIYPVLNSISIKKYKKNNIRKSLIKQLYKTVQWKKTMDVIQSKVNVILEVGMGNVLTNLYKKYSLLKCIPINNPHNFFLALKLTEKKINI